ncbi:hypothetical protein GS896_25320 [Rhodococcus hoagii]|nr:hypothetical protein [Prescottella equi]MBM4654175.1 hypothetical protein [Prescottella equi]MBM4719647.1 hypothetical protein [Prescottella equi]NKR23446.1 hypothetical protein [Prescottella equi]NKT55942.1 hypothetical protein [Prescottella equi]
MSENPEFAEIGRIMGERLKMLEEERGAVNDAATRREKAVAEEAEAQQRYAEKVQEVRDEGYVTDALLEKYGHKVAKRRGRPTKTSASASEANT